MALLMTKLLYNVNKKCIRQYKPLFIVYYNSSILPGDQGSGRVAMIGIGNWRKGEDRAVTLILQSLGIGTFSS
jgi:hypothetical protein